MRVVTVEPLDIGQALSQTGEIRPRYETDLGFRIGGQILARPVDVGSVIGRGELLARLDDQRARSQMQSAQAGLAAAEAELTRAQAEEARQSALLKDGFTTKQRYDTAVRDLQTAEARRDSAQAKLTLARENLGYTELHSDVDGIVTAVYAEAGQVVAAGQHVLRVAEPREREAVFDVPEVAFRLVPHDPEVDGQLFVDGGIINNFPASVMASMLRGPVVGVDVTSDWKLEAQAVDIEDNSLLWLLRKGRKEAPNIVRILTRSGTISGDLQTAVNRAAVDILIHPELGSIDMWSFRALDKAVEAGYRAAAAGIERIKEGLVAETPKWANFWR